MSQTHRNMADGIVHITGITDHKEDRNIVGYAHLYIAAAKLYKKDNDWKSSVKCYEKASRYLVCDKKNRDLQKDCSRILGNRTTCDGIRIFTLFV